MFSLKTHAVITGGLFAAIVVMAAVAPKDKGRGCPRPCRNLGRSRHFGCGTMRI